MRYFYRLLVLWACAFWGLAVAAVPSVPRNYSSSSTYSYWNGQADSPSAVCAGLQSQRVYTGWTFTLVSGGLYGRCEARDDRGAYVGSSEVSGNGSMCPAGSILSGSSCVCDTGYEEKDGTCKLKVTENSCTGLSDFCTGLKGQKISLEGKGQSSPPGCAADSSRPNCAMGCAGEEVGMGVSYKNSDGDWMTGQEYRVTGGTCTLPQPSDVPQKKESDCAGSVGEVNGVRVCVPSQAATGDKTSKETKNSDGTTTNTETKTTCEKGVCTTTTTTTNKDASGNTTSTSSSSSSSSQSSYCVSNKSSAVCAATNGDKNPDSKDGTDKGKDEKCQGEDCEDKPGKFEGSCMAGFTCDGDALQCAQAKEQHRRNCELFEKDTDSNSLTNKALNGTDDKSADALRARAGQVNVASTFDQAGLGWSHSCPADPRIPLGFGGSNSEFTIPFSRICGPLGVLSLAGVGITLLGCGVWVLGGKKGA